MRNKRFACAGAFLVFCLFEISVHVIIVLLLSLLSYITITSNRLCLISRYVLCISQILSAHKQIRVRADTCTHAIRIWTTGNSLIYIVSGGGRGSWFAFIVYRYDATFALRLLLLIEIDVCLARVEAQIICPCEPYLFWYSYLAAKPMSH